MKPQKKTVLIADDEATIREIYEEELREEGYDVISAATAREAVALTVEHRPDLVVMDIRMPGMDGIEGMLRVLEHDNEIPVIINSAYSSYNESFMSWSADAYLTKSSDLTELKETVARILSTENETSAAMSGD